MFNIMPYGHRTISSIDLPSSGFFLVTCDFSQCVLSFERQSGLNEVLLFEQRGKAFRVSEATFPTVTVC
jgi:hypothetical protein